MICEYCGLYYETEEKFCSTRCEADDRLERALNSGNVAVYQIITSEPLLESEVESQT